MAGFLAETLWPLGDWRWGIGVVVALLCAYGTHLHYQYQQRGDARSLQSIASGWKVTSVFWGAVKLVVILFLTPTLIFAVSHFAMLGMFFAAWLFLGFDADAARALVLSAMEGRR